MSLILDGTNGLSDVDGSASTPAIRGTDANTGIFFPAADTIAFTEGGVESLRIDSSGNVGIGTTSPSSLLTVKGEIRREFASNTALYTTVNYDGISVKGAQDAYYLVDSGQNQTWYVGATERMRITSAGNLNVNGKIGVGTSAVSTIQFYVAGSGTDYVFDFGGTGGDIMYSGFANAGITSGENAGAAILFLRKNTATSRSINAAGTINASGADYAEYMEKNGNFVIAKGDICGVDANGKLTNVFDDAVSFVVKSTNPSYVGGDVWGSEEALGLTKPKQLGDDATDEEKTQYATNKTAFDAALEAARQIVDRIAFAGQVPVNVNGATAGQYIVPVDDNGAIKGQAVSNPTFEQYQIAIGKVIAIEADGRAKIIVKVA